MLREFITKALNAAGVERDLVIVVLFSLISLYITSTFELAEKYFIWTEMWESYELDELIFLFFFISIGLIWFSVRRLSESQANLKQMILMQDKLEKKNREINELLDKNLTMMRRVVSIRETERQHLANELHDVFGQHLAAMDANLVAVQYRLPQDEKMKAVVQSVIDSSQVLSDLTRHKLRELKPPVLKNLGLTAAIEELIEQWQHTFSQYQVNTNIDIDDRLVSEDVALTLYRTVQEGLNNIVKHAQADQVSISLVKLSNTQVVLSLTDNGVGCDAKQVIGTGIGLVAMRERCLSLQGQFYLDKNEPKGTEIKVILPCQN